jgi:DNA-binding MarR family transcriptional regulator
VVGNGLAVEPVKDIADYFNVHYSTVSRAIKRTESENV